jgi:3-hydroxyisobutyrate dehydrogenase-like beta-hydroxyacid dehydrogenase
VGAAARDVVVSMVVDGEQVAEIMLGADGVVEAARPGLIAVDCSTIGPAATRRIGADLAARGIIMLDAPVTGSSPAAQDGTLTIMVGGEAQALAPVRPLLETMGRLVVHVGGPGDGQMVKLFNNSLAAANATALAEALLLGEAAGLDLDALEEVVSAGSGASAQLTVKSRPMREHDFATLFKTEHMLKDVELCLAEARTAGVPFPSAANARELLAAAVADGHGEDDYASLIDAAERRRNRGR